MRRVSMKQDQLPLPLGENAIQEVPSLKHNPISSCRYNASQSVKHRVMSNHHRPMDMLSFLANDEWIVDDTKPASPSTVTPGGLEVQVTHSPDSQDEFSQDLSENTKDT